MKSVKLSYRSPKSDVWIQRDLNLASRNAAKNQSISRQMNKEILAGNESGKDRQIRNVPAAISRNPKHHVKPLLQESPQGPIIECDSLIPVRKERDVIIRSTMQIVIEDLSHALKTVIFPEPWNPRQGDHVLDLFGCNYR